MICHKTKADHAKYNSFAFGVNRIEELTDSPVYLDVSGSKYIPTVFGWNGTEELIDMMGTPVYYDVCHLKYYHTVFLKIK